MAWENRIVKHDVLPAKDFLAHPMNFRLHPQHQLTPHEVWAVAGSGALIRALQAAWPQARCYAVQIGRDPDIGNAQLYRAPESFEQRAQLPPSFPSSSWYDAKAWRFIRQYATPGALFWNVGA